MNPRKLHLLILSVLCAGPACAGVYFIVKGDRSHSDLSGLVVVLGLGLFVGCAIYAAISSLLVWKLGTTPRRVFAVHGGIFGLGAVLFGLPRLYYLVAR